MLEAVQAVGEVAQLGQGGFPADGVPVPVLLPADVIVISLNLSPLNLSPLNLSPLNLSPLNLSPWKLSPFPVSHVTSRVVMK